jgi:uncharacterized protein (DUF952 family)
MSSVMAQSLSNVPELIYHIALPEHLEQAQAAGVYTMSTRDVTIAQEGYMHASFENQVDGTFERYYRDVPNACVLVIDTGRVIASGVKVIVEQLGSAPAAFPHIYGVLPVDCIVRVRSLADWTSGLH